MTLIAHAVIHAHARKHRRPIMHVCASISWFLRKTFEDNYNLILQMRKLRFGEVTWLAKDHPGTMIPIQMCLNPKRRSFYFPWLFSLSNSHLFLVLLVFSAKAWLPLADSFLWGALAVRCRVPGFPWKGSAWHFALGAQWAVFGSTFFASTLSQNLHLPPIKKYQSRWLPALKESGKSSFGESPGDE